MASRGWQPASLLDALESLVPMSASILLLKRRKSRLSQISKSQSKGRSLIGHWVGTGAAHQPSADEKPPASELKTCHQPAMATARSYPSKHKMVTCSMDITALRVISFMHIADVFGLG